MAQEKNFENKIKRYLVGRDCYEVKFFANAFTKSGVPDILACVNGRFLAIEVKAENGRPSELQLHNIGLIRQSGGLAYVVYPSGWFRLKDIIDNLIKGNEVTDEEVILR